MLQRRSYILLSVASTGNGFGDGTGTEVISCPMVVTIIFNRAMNLERVKPIGGSRYSSIRTLKISLFLPCFGSKGSISLKALSISPVAIRLKISSLVSSRVTSFPVLIDKYFQPCTKHGLVEIIRLG